jgi:hypothetical protein
MSGFIGGFRGALVAFRVRLGFHHAALQAAGFAAGGTFPVVGFLQDALRFGHDFVPCFVAPPPSAVNCYTALGGGATFGRYLESLSLQTSPALGKMGNRLPHKFFNKNSFRMK